MENRHYDKLLKNMLHILDQDYAGKVLKNGLVDDRYYIQAAGMAWKEKTLNDLLFYRLTSQLLATTFDRSLHVQMVGMMPWHVGFDARRVGDNLVVTGLHGENRLYVGDVITRLNALSPGQHKSQFQKNFLFADEPEREMWGNVLKMTKHVCVTHRDGTKDDIVLNHFETPRPIESTQVRILSKGAVYVNLGEMPQEEAVFALVEQNKALLNSADRLILDLRHCRGENEDGLLPLMPYILKNKKSMNEAAGETTIFSLYTPENCARRVSALQAYSGNADAYMKQMESMSGKGWVKETFSLWDDLPNEIAPCGHQTYLLTDTWTEGAPEEFVRIAKNEGRAVLLGRPTMGKTDTCGLITVALAKDVLFTYPMAVTEQAKNGCGYKNKGIAPDVYVPFAPEELEEDAIVKKAME